MKIKSTLLFILLLAGTLNFYTACAQVNVNDSLALVDLYNSTGGASWLNNTNWLTGNVSTWYGIDVIDKRVTKIVMPNNNLKGPLTATIGNLTKLEEITLYLNDLSGEIPETIGNLTQLKVLNLLYNNLSGKIPVSAGNLTNITYFNISTNQLTDTIPSGLGNLVNCTDLYISDNLLTGNIPASLSNLKNLFILNLRNNQLSGTIPESIGNLNGLIYLYLDRNNLTGAVPVSFKKLKIIKTVDLRYNQLTFNRRIDTAFGFHRFDLLASHNRFTFDGIEFIAKTNPKFYYYKPQAIIPVHKSNKMLSVSAGGTLGNNTYTWHKKGNVTSVAVTGDSTFTPTESGMYYAKVTNAIAYRLVLTTDTVIYQTEEKNLLSVALYPNPVKNLLTVKGLDTNDKIRISITDINGKVLITGVAEKQLAASYNVSKLKPGNYVVNVTDGNSLNRLHFIKE